MSNISNASSYIGRIKVFVARGERKTIDQWFDSSKIENYSLIDIFISLFKINYMFPLTFNRDNKKHNQSNYYIYKMHTSIYLKIFILSL